MTDRGDTHAEARVLAVVSGLAVLATTISLTNVVAGTWWLIHCAVVIVMICANGYLMRRINSPAVLVSCGQFAVLTLSLTLLFGSGWGMLPGPTGIRELGALLVAAIDQARDNVAPVPATTAVAGLACLGVGLVAVLADTLAVTARAPASCGLVLLSMFAVPAALLPELLPWWSFALAAGGFAVLLAVEDRRRTDNGQQVRRTVTRANAGPAGALLGVALLFALVIGQVSTFVGTDGKVPDVFGGSQDSGFDLDPFTSLSGQLDRSAPVEMFRVKGDIGRNYLRALTLRRFDADKGVWQPEGIEDGVAVLGRALPLPPGVASDAKGQRRRIEIERRNYVGAWLPTFAVPVRLEGTPEDLRYDAKSGTVFTRSGTQADRYTEDMLVSDPSEADLRAASGTSTVDRLYLRTDGVNDRVVELAKRLTTRARTPFDRARVLNDYFRDPANGFRYNLRTSGGEGPDPLSRFLFEGKVGFCQQYASALAVMLRAVDVPSRVAVGYTSGTPVDPETRMITTNDAHAWVEAWFPGHGWTQFEPTPSLDDRTNLPEYLAPRRDEPGPAGPQQQTAGPTTSVGSTPGRPDQERRTDPDGLATARAAESGLLTGTPLMAVLALPGAAIGSVAWAWAVLLRRHRRGRTDEELVADLFSWWPGPARLLWIGAAGGGTLFGGLALFLLVATRAGVLWWSGTVLIACCGWVVVPGLVRRTQRVTRLRQADLGGPVGARAAWREVLATAADRDVGVTSTGTVRATSRVLTGELTPDESGRSAMGALVEAVERAWYSDRPTAGTVGTPAREVLSAIGSARPLTRRQRLFPISVTRPDRMISGV